jgi:hypothetical protein
MNGVGYEWCGYECVVCVDCVHNGVNNVMV